MHNKPQEVLCDLIAKHGRSLAEDKGRCSALLRDYCSAYKAEINILITALDEQVPSLLIKQPTSSPADVVISQLVKRLRIDRGLAEENARWAVETWALALGVVQSTSLSSSVPKPLPPKPPILGLGQTGPQPSNGAEPETPTHLTSSWAWKPAHLLALVIAFIFGAIILKNEFSNPEKSAQTTPASENIKTQENEKLKIQLEQVENAKRQDEIQRKQAEDEANRLRLENERIQHDAQVLKDELKRKPPEPTSSSHDGLIKVVNDYYAALGRRDVGAASDLWKKPPNKLSALVNNVDYIKVNDAKIVSTESYRASVWVDVTGKSLDRVSPVRWQGNIELEPISSGKWGIASMKLDPVESDRPKPTSTPTVVQDELVALVRQYYAALDRRDDKSAVALWKNPPKGLIALVKNVDYFKVNEASFRSAELDHASVWVDVIGKSLGAAKLEHWQGLVELEKDAGKWGIVAMRVDHTK